MNTWYSIKAAAKAGGRAQVYVYGEIGDWGVSADQFRRDVEALGGAPLDVRISSPGGSAWDGIAMHTILSRLPDVDTYADSAVASAATLPFMAGKRRVMATGASLFIHNPWYLAAGDATELRKIADGLDIAADSLAAVYAKATGKGLDEVKKVMSADTWLGAEEAKAEGWATDIGEAVTIQANIAPGRYPNTPKAFVRENPANEEKSKNPMSNKLLALLGVSASERETFLASAVTSLGVTEDAITAAQKDGKADFVAEHIKARIADADAKTTAAIGERDAAAKARDEHKAKADALLSAAGVTEPGDDIAKTFKAALDARVSKEVAEQCAKMGIKPVAAEKPDSGKTAEDIVAQFNAMKPGPERSKFFAQHRAVIVGG